MLQVSVSSGYYMNCNTVISLPSVVHSLSILFWNHTTSAITMVSQPVDADFTLTLIVVGQGTTQLAWGVHRQLMLPCFKTPANAN